MDKKEILGILESIVDESQVGVLATIDSETESGGPALRWMTPALVSGRPGFLYAITSPHFRKVKHIEANPMVEWMIQTRDLNRIVSVRGRALAVDNPSLKTEVMEAIGKRLEVFWRVNQKTDFLVLETEIHSVTLFRPLEKRKEFVSLI